MNQPPIAPPQNPSMNSSYNLDAELSSVLDQSIAWQKQKGKSILLFKQQFSSIKANEQPSSSGFVPQNLTQINKMGYPNEIHRAEVLVLSDDFDLSTNIRRLFLLGRSKIIFRLDPKTFFLSTCSEIFFLQREHVHLEHL
jgi:hypothetical protein